MAKVGEVEGLRETLEALREFPRATGRATLRRALVKAAYPVAIVARNAAPDDPRTPAPDLRRSITVATQLTRRHRATKRNEVEVYVGPTTQIGRNVMAYASAVEFGTFRATAHPYLRPAWDRTKGLVLTILTRELTAEFEKTAQRLSNKRFRAYARSVSR